MNDIVVGMVLNFRSPIVQSRLDLLDSVPRQSNAVRDPRRSVCHTKQRLLLEVFSKRRAVRRQDFQLIGNIVRAWQSTTR